MDTKYVAVWNIPGCLPEMEPMEFDSFDEAKRAIIDALKEAEDGAETEAEAEKFCHLAEDVNLESGPFAAYAPDGYAYCVQNPDGSNRIPSKSRETMFSEARACVVRDWPNQDDVARLYRALDEIERRGSFEPSVAALLRAAEYLAFPS